MPSSTYATATNSVSTIAAATDDLKGARPS